MVETREESLKRDRLENLEQIEFLMDERNEINTELKSLRADNRRIERMLEAVGETFDLEVEDNVQIVYRNRVDFRNVQREAA